MTRSRRVFRRDDQAVTEVVGYILTFALSAIILLISVQSFTVARQNSDGVVTAVELKAIASRVATRVIEAGLVSQEFPNSTFTMVINIPQELNGHEYTVVVDSEKVTVTALDGTAVAEATTLRLDAISGLQVSGATVYSSNERVTIEYSLVGTQPIISIR
jgi:hypothetical protein